MKKTITHDYSGLSLLELLKKHGKGAKGFYDNPWWHDEPFAKEKPSKGKYELNVSNDLANLKFDDQVKKLKEGFEVAHPAVLCEALIEHYAKTGDYIVTGYWLRTSCLDSGSDRVLVGFCGAEGVDVGRNWDGLPGGNVGVGASRKFGENLEHRNLNSVVPSSLELRVSALEQKWERLEKLIKET